MPLRTVFILASIHNLPYRTPSINVRAGKMSKTFTPIYYHLVFSTKNRENHLTSQIQQELYTYMCGIMKNDQGFVYVLGGRPDHIHLLCSIPPKIAVSKILQSIKGASSSWIHKKFPSLSFFQWQSGYGVFSVSHSQKENVSRYILTQEEHHRNMSFQDEFRSLLKKHGISYDEKFIWI